MTYLFWLIIFGITGYFIGKSGKKSQEEVDQQLSKQNNDWFAYIKSFHKIAKDKSQKKLIDDILVDIKKQGLVAPEIGADMQPAYIEEPISDRSQEFAVAGNNVAAASIQQANTQAQAAVQIPQKPKTEIQLDNASLLLYLGAFIFVASVGLFVAFGDFGGYLKTAIVLLLAITLYAAGVLLYKSEKKLTQVGVAFAAIGMAMVPFVGLAAYLYIFEQANGAVVWLATSLLCIAVYTHALIFFKKPFLNYIFIFTLLSLFESSVSVISVPIYYFGWAMAFLGIVLAFIATFKNVWPDFKESATVSGQLFIPISVVISLAMFESQGSIQLGISLALAAAYYGLQTLNSKEGTRENYAVITQVLSIGSILWLAYGVSESIVSVAIVAVAINLLQLCFVSLFSKQNSLWHNFASVLAASAIVGMLLALQDSTILLIAVLLFLFVGVSIWVRQQRLEGYVMAATALMTVPLIIGQLVIDQGVSMLTQSVLIFTALLIQWVVYINYKNDTLQQWRETAQFMFVASIAATCIVGFLADPFICLAVSVGAALLALSLTYFDKDKNWAVIAGAVIAVPVARTIGSEDLLLCVAAALVANIAIALMYRQELNRWIGSALWFLVPYAMGNGVLGDEWTTELYAYAYMLVAVGYIIARAIARGVWFVSSKVPMASYAKSASLSYVIGYAVAVTVSIFISLFSSESQVLTTALFAITIGLTVLLAKFIEKELSLYALVPLLAQAMLLSALRPEVTDSNAITVLVLVSSALAVLFYFGSKVFTVSDGLQPTKIAALITAFLAPLSVFAYEPLWAMPATFIVASMLLYYHYKDASQAEREAIGGVFTFGVLWLMWQLGVRETQAFTHVIVALFAGYAVWRSRRGEKEASDQYIIAMLATATIPLILQALSGAAGGLYGWWLLLEQIAFIIIGMFIGNKFMTQWGLYVAVAAVLYQLRGLGWAALAFLGVFVIAVAAYQINRINKN